MRMLDGALVAIAFLIVSPVTLGSAVAADMPEYPPIIDMPEPLPIVATGGWYLRGDIGYKFYNDPTAELSNPNYASGTYTGGLGSLIDESLDDAYNVGIGAGFRFNEYFRTDLTLDYESPAGFEGRLFCPGPVSGSCGASGVDLDGDGTNDGYSTERADITAWSALANAYVDLGTYAGLTPYVGAGAGLSYLTTSDVRTAGGSTYNGDGKFNFAWALMAGASYAVDQQVSIDVGYRYINLGDAQSGVIVASDTTTTRINYNDIDAHEIRVGLRYNLY